MTDPADEGGPGEPDLAVDGPLALPDGTDLSTRADLAAAGGPHQDQPYAPDEHVFDPASDVGLTAGQGTES